VVEKARRVMGSIDIDPCTDEEQNQGVVKATMFYDEQSDGLTSPWDYSALFDNYGEASPTNALVNPDGKIVREMWTKALNEFRTNRCKAIFWVGYSLEQLAYLAPNPLLFSYCILRKRLRFTAWRWHMGEGYKWERVLDTDDNPTHSNYLVLMTRDVIARKRFEEEFSDFGFVRLEGQIVTNTVRVVAAPNVQSEFTESRLRLPSKVAQVEPEPGGYGTSWRWKDFTYLRSRPGDVY
jgi:hypothetical protein